MPSLKRNVTSAPDKTGFEPYDGDSPKPGLYRAKITSGKVIKAGSGRLGYLIVAELEAEKGSDKAQYDGYPAFTRLWLGDSDQLQTREKKFYMAVCGKPEANVVFEADDSDDEIGRIKTINGKKIEGQYVIVDLQNEKYDGDERLASDGIMAVKGKKAGKVEEPDEEPDEVEDDEDDETIEIPSEADLKKMAIKDLRALAEDLGIDTDDVKKKADLIAAILEEADEDDEDEVEDDEDDDLEDAEDEDDEDDEDDEEEEDDEDAAAALLEDLKDLNRAALKARLKESNEEFKVLKRHSDDDLRNAIVAAEIGIPEKEAPF